MNGLKGKKKKGLVDLKKRRKSGQRIRREAGKREGRNEGYRTGTVPGAMRSRCDDEEGEGVRGVWEGGGCTWG